MADKKEKEEDLMEEEEEELDEDEIEGSLSNADVVTKYKSAADIANRMA
jgi:hypothetical protein